MTHLVGWKSDKEAFICADTAISWQGRVNNPNRASSFGERHVVSDQLSVFEGVLKVFNFGQAALGIAGNVTTARNMACEFRDRMANGAAPRAAFQQTALSCWPQDRGRMAQLIAAIPEEPSPALLVFNSDGSGRVDELRAGESVPLGSIGDEHKAIASAATDLLSQVFESDPRTTLTGVLGFLQGLGARNYLLKTDRAGGAYAGLFASTDAIHWQPDLEYVLYPSSRPNYSIAVTSVIWRDRLAVNSSIPGQEGWLGFGDTLVTGEKGKQEFYEEFMKEAPRFLKHGEFEHVIALNTEAPHVVIFETRRQLVTPHLTIRLADGDQALQMTSQQRQFSRLASAALQSPPQQHSTGAPNLKLDWFPFDGEPWSCGIEADPARYLHVTRTR